MLKKPLFWIIVVIVIVILWFVFTCGRKEDASSVSTPAATSTTNGSTAGTGTSGS